ncbi:hypothetical protein ACKGJY_11940 [Hyunsoonleella sp. 2307UL5-6]|uniref:hypothetical protein n=1 Tax=Hyunsoonleella sp. 2307UL5-6 TaxID=3384768 RepID=UPI0039BC6198
MKAKLLFMLCSLLVFFTLSSFSIETASDELLFIIQDIEEVNAIYKGSSDEGYSFKVEDNGEAFTMVFQQIEEPVLSVFDLHSKTFIDVIFKVSYTTEIDDNGDAITTITKLEKL